MLQALGFLVNVNPFHAENLEEHALDQVMAKNGSLGDLASFGGQLNAALLQGDQSVSSQPLEGRGDRRWRYAKPMGQERGDHRLPFRLSLGNGLEIVLFGNGDHHDVVASLSLSLL